MDWHVDALPRGLPGPKAPSRRIAQRVHERPRDSYAQSELRHRGCPVRPRRTCLSNSGVGESATGARSDQPTPPKGAPHRHVRLRRGRLTGALRRVVDGGTGSTSLLRRRVDTHAIVEADPQHVGPTAHGTVLDVLLERAGAGIDTDVDRLTARGTNVMAEFFHERDPGSAPGLAVIDVTTCVLGAGCLDGNCYELMTASNCLALGGTYLGNTMTCAGANCPRACVSDLDGNGLVGFGDLTQILADLGACP